MKQTGFTLIELLVVIGVIGLLAAMVLVSLSSARRAADASRVLADFHQINNAFNLWMSDTGESLMPRETAYSTASQVCSSGEPVLSNSDIFINAQNLAGWNGPYVSSIPKTPWGTEYSYDNDGDIWPTDGWTAGVNIKIVWCNSANGNRGLNIASRLDSQLDKGDGSTAGIVRWSGGNSSGTLRILMAPRGK